MIQSNITHSLHVLHGNITKNSRKQTIPNQYSILTPRYNTQEHSVTFHQKYLTCFKPIFLNVFKTGLHVTSRRPSWWPRPRSFFTLGTKLHCHVNSPRKNFIVLTPQHSRLVTWLQTKNTLLFTLLTFLCSLGEYNP